MSSPLAPNSIAAAASAIRSPARGPRMCTPSTRSVSACGEDLHAAVGAARAPRARPLARNGNDALRYGDAAALRAPLRSCRPTAISGCGVDDAGDRVVVDVAVAGDDALDAGDAFFLGLVREHRARDHVADGVDAARASSRKCSSTGMRPCVVELDADRARGRGPSVFGTRPTATSTRSHAIGSLPSISTTHAVALRRCAPVTRAAEAELEALLLEDLLRLVGDLGVHAGQDAVEVLEHRDLRAEPRARPSPARGRCSRRRSRPGARAPRSYDSASVLVPMRSPSSSTPGSGARLAAGGDQDVLGVELDRRLRRLDHDRARARDAGRARGSA